MTALVDADILVYRTAFVFGDEKPQEDTSEFECVDLELDQGNPEDRAKKSIDLLLKSILEDVGATEVVLCFTARGRSYRKELFPAYKANRKHGELSEDVVKYLRILKEYLQSKYPYFEIEGIEADDILGILTTSPRYKGNCVLCSTDKDLLQIPGTSYNWVKKDLWTKDRATGYYEFLKQTLMGDPVDNFRGIPKVGQKTAEKILDAVEDPTFGTVVKAYEDRGMTKEDAVTQGNMAKILTWDDISEDCIYLLDRQEWKVDLRKLYEHGRS